MSRQSVHVPLLLSFALGFVPGALVLAYVEFVHDPPYTGHSGDLSTLPLVLASWLVHAILFISFFVLARSRIERVWIAAACGFAFGAGAAAVVFLTELQGGTDRLLGSTTLEAVALLTIVGLAHAVVATAIHAVGRPDRPSDSGH